MRGSKVQFGDGLTVTDEGSGVIRVDGSGGAPGATGPAGPPGATGPAGPPGPSGTADANYVHTQGTLASSWVVLHNLGKFASVVMVDSGGSVLIPNVQYDNANQITLTFAAPTSGKAYVN